MIRIGTILVILLNISELIYFFNLFSFMGYAVTLTDASLLLIYLYTAYQFFIQKKKFSYHESKIYFSLFGLYFAYVFSVIGLLTWGGAIAILQYIKTISHFTYIVLYAYLTLSVEFRKDTFFRVVQVLIYSSIIINLYAIYQLFARMFGLPFAFIEITNAGFLNREYGREIGQMNQIVLSFQNFYRATSIFSEPSALATYNFWILSFLLVPFFSKTKQFISKKSILIFIGILSIITLLITFSLSGLILIGLLLISIIILEKISIKRFLMPIMILVVVLISSDMFLKNYTQISILDLFSQRVSGLLFTQKTGMGMTTGESAPQRVSSIINAWNLFIESPIVGIGVGNTYYHPKSEQRYADSSFFHVLSETGIIGLFFFVLLFVNIFRISIFLRKYRYRFLKKFPELSTMQSYILYWVIISAFQHVFLGNAVGNAGFWISLGLIFGTYNSTMRELVENKETNLEP